MKSRLISGFMEMFCFVIKISQPKAFVCIQTSPDVQCKYKDMMGSLLLFSKTVLPCLQLALSNFFNFIIIYLSFFLLEVCLHLTGRLFQPLKLVFYCLNFLLKFLIPFIIGTHPHYHTNHIFLPKQLENEEVCHFIITFQQSLIKFLYSTKMHIGYTVRLYCNKIT